MAKTLKCTISHKQTSSSKRKDLLWLTQPFLLLGFRGLFRREIGARICRSKCVHKYWPISRRRYFREKSQNLACDFFRISWNISSKYDFIIPLKVSSREVIVLFSPLVITLCCFVRVRLPRTKSEIYANARRKALLKNFQSKLTTLKSADLDDMDYRRGKAGKYWYYSSIIIS